MTIRQKLSYKKNLHQHCISILQQRIDATMQAIQNAQAAANSEEKSSAGDKYETSRAMSHLEKDMHARQFGANQQELAALLAVDCSKLYTAVATGSIVVCNSLSFFIAAGLGKITFQEVVIYLLSPHAPVAKLLLHKVAGNSITFNNKELLIEAVF